MFQNVAVYYNEFFEKRGDPRNANYALMSTPTLVLMIFIAYIWIVKVIGPKFMRNRKPFDLKNAILIYNAFQVFLSAYMFYEGMLLIWELNYSFFTGNSIDYSWSSRGFRGIFCTYTYFIAKYTELLDTIFFVLRKKEKQISFLHVYHHGTTPIYAWIGCKFAPGGSMVVIIALNSFIHIFMYGYYTFAALGPKYQKYLWWKKYLTAMQLIQFILLLIHFLILLFTPDNNIPKPVAAIYTSNIIINYLLFSFFYKKEYKTEEKSKNESNGVQNSKISEAQSKNGHLSNDLKNEKPQRRLVNIS